LFYNLRINIFIYYFVTVVVFLALLYYLLMVLAIQNIFVIISVLLFFVLLSAIFISKLSIEPLQEHILNLQNLSKETLHELNLPISTIKTNLQMIKKNSNDEKILKRLKRIDDACEMLQQRYNELDYMIKTQTKQNTKERFNVAQLVEDRVNFLSSIYPHANFTLNLQNTTIYNDKTGLSKVIDNIIDNGVKYSPNSCKIDIKLDSYTLSIQDFGCGMDEVELLKIFDNYYQSDKSMHGFGIGLGMVKRFCDTNNIGLNIKSKPDFGTTLILTFKEA